jgi:hypothetical protein
MGLRPGETPQWTSEPCMEVIVVDRLESFADPQNRSTGEQSITG